jgi:TRAF3-interacting protein 1
LPFFLSFLSLNMAEEYWEKTSRLLGEIISKPRMTQKHLSRPPFRYIFDIFYNIVEETGFGKGLLTEEELDSSNYKSKEMKVEFVNRVIDFVGIALNMHVPTRALKVVAGMDAKDTNTFLQMLSEAATDFSIDREAVVARVLAGEHQPPKQSASSPASKSGRPVSRRGSDAVGTEEDSDLAARRATRDVEKKRAAEIEVRRRREADADLERQREADEDSQRQAEEDERKRKQQAKKEKERAKREKEEREKEEREQEEQRRQADERKLVERRRREERAKAEKEREKREREEEEETERTRPMKRESDDEESEEEDEDGGGDTGATRSAMQSGPPPAPRDTQEEPAVVPAPRLARPQSARRPPPKVRTNERSAVETRGPSELPPRLPDRTELSSAGRRPSRGSRGGLSSGGGLGDTLDEPVRTGVIVEDGKDNDNDDDDDGGVEVDEDDEQDMMDRPDGSVMFMDGGGSRENADVEGAGVLLRDILRAKEESEEMRNVKGGGVRRDDVVGHREHKERAKKEEQTKKLGDMIQQLCQRTGPLGRMVELLQEDLETMTQELQIWKSKCDEFDRRLCDDDVDIDHELHPLRVQLSEVDTQIKDEDSRIYSLRAQILANDDKIHSLLNMVVGASDQ